MTDHGWRETDRRPLKYCFGFPKAEKQSSKETALGRYGTPRGSARSFGSNTPEVRRCVRFRGRGSHSSCRGCYARYGFLYI